MQTIIHILHFRLRKEVRNFILCRLLDRIWTLYAFRRLRYWFSILLPYKTIFTRQLNLEISWMIYRHSLNIQCSTVADKMKLLCCNGNQIHQKDSVPRSGGICILNLSFLCLKKMAEIETFILLPWQLIYPSNHTQKLLFKSTVTSIPNLGLLHLQTAEI